MIENHEQFEKQIGIMILELALQIMKAKLMYDETVLMIFEELLMRTKD